MATTIQATPIDTRNATAMWVRALDRAIQNALDVLVEPISGEAFVESATRPGKLYAVSATTCTCPAGAHGVPCQHRACYLAQIGALPLPVSVPVATPPCPACTAGKVEEFGVSGPIGCKPCPACDGTGVVPAPATRPYGLPVIEIVAAAA